MRKVALLLIFVSVISCGNNFLQGRFPDYPDKTLNLTLNENFIAQGILPTVGIVEIQYNFFSTEVYVTDKDCQKCEQYSNHHENPFVCDKSQGCYITNNTISQSVVDNYQIYGNQAQLPITLNKQQVNLRNAKLVKDIVQINPENVYSYYSIGLGMDQGGQSSFIKSLQYNNIISKQSYSLYFENSSNAYKLCIGGFNRTLLLSDIKKLLTVTTTSRSDINYLNDVVYANLTLYSQPLQDTISNAVLIDPSVEGIVFPKKMYNTVYSALQQQNLLPDIQEMTQNQKGKWSNLSKKPSLSIYFMVEKSELPSKYWFVPFTPEELFEMDSEGNYSPKFSFSDSDDESGYSIIRMGKALLQKVMYYKFVDNNQQYHRGIALLRYNNIQQDRSTY